MPLFKKIMWTLFIILLIICGLYFAFYYYYKLNIDSNINVFKDFIKLVNEIPKTNLIEAVFKPIYYGFMDTIIYVFTFNYKNISDSVKLYFIFELIVSIPLLLTLFRYLTYRGFKAFKLEFKKAKANPDYYNDWKIDNKTSTYDNIDEMNASIMPIVISLRIILLIPIILILPILIVFYLFLEIIGIIKGITHTGRALDFD